MASELGPPGNSVFDRQRELAHFGAVIDFTIRRDEQTAGMSVRGLIDTGASHVLIDRRIATKLALREENLTRIGVAGGHSIESAVFGGIVSVPELGFELPMPLYSADFAQGDHNVLLGRDFLKHFIMTFNGPAGLFQFFPPDLHTLIDPLDDFAT